MKILKLLILIPILSITFCKKPNSQVPECINELIKNRTNVICASGASVSQYLFQGDYVYVFDPGNCGADLMAVVYNSECSQIGGLGGIAGNNIINGTQFNPNAKFIKTIWTE